MRRDVQDARRRDLLQRLFGRAASGDQRRFGKQRLDRACFVRGAGERREVQRRQRRRGRHAAALRGGRLAAGVRFRRRLAEKRIGEDDRRAPAVMRNLHAEQVAAAGEVTDRVALIR